MCNQTAADAMIELQSLIAAQRADVATNGRVSYIPSGYPTCSLVEAELEEENQQQPIHGCAYTSPYLNSYLSSAGGVYEYTDWWSDGECTHREE